MDLLNLHYGWLLQGTQPYQNLYPSQLGGRAPWTNIIMWKQWHLPVWKTAVTHTPVRHHFVCNLTLFSYHLKILFEFYILELKLNILLNTIFISGIKPTWTPSVASAYDFHSKITITSWIIVFNLQLNGYQEYHKFWPCLSP